MAGQVLEWKGKYGWIQAIEHIVHPKTRMHQGRIYVSSIDLLGTRARSGRLVPGSFCEFFLFEDASGLGAEECIEIDDLAPAVESVAAPALAPARMPKSLAVEAPADMEAGPMVVLAHEPGECSPPKS